MLSIIKKRLQLSFAFYRLISNELIEKGILEYKIPNKIANSPDSRWTYDYNPKDYNGFTYDEALNLVLGNMQKLSDLLARNETALSVAVYPLPTTLINDVEKNSQQTLHYFFC